LTIFELLTKSL